MLSDSSVTVNLVHTVSILFHGDGPILSGMYCTARRLSGMSRCSQPAQADNDFMYMAHCCNLQAVVFFSLLQGM